MIMVLHSDHVKNPGTQSPESHTDAAMIRASVISCTGNLPVRVTPDDILAGPIGTTIYRMTTPMVIGIFTMMTFAAVDTFFVSMLGSEELAAISFTLPLTTLLFNLILGLSIATSVLVGSTIGSRGMAEAARTTTHSLMLCMLVIIAVSALGYFTIDPLFSALGASNLTLPLIHEYMDIYYLFFGLMVIPMVGNAAIRATGDTRWPSFLMVGSGTINMVLDPLLIFGIGPFPALGIAGAAWATVFSWLAGCIGGFCILYFREKLIVFSKPVAGEIRVSWSQVLRIGIPISLANMMMPLATAAMTRMVAQYGEIAVAGLGAGSRLESFAMVVPFAITAALSPFMAQNLGADNIQRAQDALVGCIQFILKFQLLIWIVFSGGAVWLAQLYSSDPEVVRITRYYLWIMPLGMGFYAVLIVINAAFNAAHRSDRTLLTSSIRILLLYIPLAWLGGALLGLPGIFIGATIGNIGAAAVAWCMYLRTRPEPQSGAIEINPDTEPFESAAHRTASDHLQLERTAARRPPSREI